MEALARADNTLSRAFELDPTNLAAAYNLSDVLYRTRGRDWDYGFLLQPEPLLGEGGRVGRRAGAAGRGRADGGGDPGVYTFADRQAMCGRGLTELVGEDAVVQYESPEAIFRRNLDRRGLKYTQERREIPDEIRLPHAWRRLEPEGEHDRFDQLAGIERTPQARLRTAQADFDKARIDLRRREAVAASGAVSGEAPL